MNKDQHDPPKTIREVGIHLYNMSSDISDIKDSLNNTPNRTEFETLKGKVIVLESTLDTIKNRIVGGAIIILVGLILAQYGLNTYF